MNDEKDFTSDNRFDYPVPGVKFLHKGVEVDLRKTTEAKMQKLAADTSCKFVQLKGEPAKTTTTAASTAPLSTPPSAKGDK